MSLTRELQNPNSIISRFLNSILDPVESQVLTHTWNIKLEAAETIKLSSDVNPALVGTAFDYAFRWTVADYFDPEGELIGIMGAVRADKQNYQYHVSALKELIKLGNKDTHLRPAICIILSWYERIVRERNFKMVEQCFAQRSTSIQETMQMLKRNVPLAEFIDVTGLMKTISTVWGNRLDRKFTLNPIMPNSAYVGGADADWIIDGILYDCKCSWKSSPFTKDHLRQVMAYALLDWDDKLNLRGVGWYYARQQIIIEYPLEEILPNIAQKRADLKARYTQPKTHHHTNNLRGLDAHLEDILWKHHGNQIEGENIRFLWERNDW